MKAQPLTGHRPMSINILQELLLEAETRAEVCPMLGLPQILDLVQRFEPDDYTPEPVPQHLIRSLEQQVMILV